MGCPSRRYANSTTGRRCSGSSARTARESASSKKLLGLPGIGRAARFLEGLPVHLVAHPPDAAAQSERPKLPALTVRPVGRRLRTLASRPQADPADAVATAKMSSGWKRSATSNTADDPQSSE